MKNILTCSENISHEYCCTVVRIGEVKPIEGADFLGQTMVNGLSIVVRKDMVHEGDLMIYASNESALSLKFLAVNNQFEMSHRELNSNYEEVERKLNLAAQLKNEDKFEEAADIELEVKQMVGFFNQHGRVKMIRLKGCPSMGYLFGKDSLVKYCPNAEKLNLEEHVGEDFDTVDGELFIKAYVPPMRNMSQHGAGEGRRAKKRMKRLARYDRMIPGQFAFHYETQQLNRSMYRINPDDIVSLSVKLHGTSGIIGNILTKTPKYDTGWFGKLYSKSFVYLPKFLQFTKSVYDVVCSSRTVIINSYINPNKGEGFAGGMVQKNIEEYSNLIGKYLPEGTTVYFEIVGYYSGTLTYIQKVGDGYDYGCAEGTNKMMPYRITTTQEDGSVFEWEVEEVHDWTVKMLNDHEELTDKMMPIQILYHGPLKNLYPNIPVENHWHENVLEALKAEKKFYMEKYEPLCKNKVYREGIVLRIDHDPMREAFKLKCLKFLGKESEEIDKGNYSDSEVAEKYGSDEMGEE